MVSGELNKIMEKIDQISVLKSQQLKERKADKEQIENGKRQPGAHIQRESGITSRQYWLIFSIFHYNTAFNSIYVGQLYVLHCFIGGAVIFLSTVSLPFCRFVDIAPCSPRLICFWLSSVLLGKMLILKRPNIELE